MMTATASTGIGGRWMNSPFQSSSPLRLIKMPAFVHQKQDISTLQISQEEFNKDKGKHTSFFRRTTNQRFQKMQCKAFSDPNHPILLVADQLQMEAIIDKDSHFVGEIPNAASTLMNQLYLIDIDAATAKTLIGVLGPFLSGFGFLFILRIVMSWYPKLPVGKFPYVIAYAPTEPLLAPTRKLIPPLAGVDVTPVVWFGLLSFLNEILVGPQGLLVLLSQQV